MIAYCFADGELQFASRLPAGALPIARHEGRKGTADWKRMIKNWCRRSYDGQVYLVPGIPEAPDQMAAVDALSRFVNRIEKIYKKRQRFQGVAT